MIRLELLGEHTHLHSSTCERCPQGPSGCCASPPGVEWSDIGRIVALGGQQWLIDQLASGNLRPGPRGLLMRRSEPRADEHGEWPRKCVYHGPAGCTIAVERRAATCNYYLCDDAFALDGEGEGEPTAVAARVAQDRLVELLGAWDRNIAARVEACWPGGPPWDLRFLGWLGEEHRRLVRASRRELGQLSPALSPRPNRSAS